MSTRIVLGWSQQWGNAQDIVASRHKWHTGDGPATGESHGWLSARCVDFKKIIEKKWVERMATRWSPQNKSGLPWWRWLNSDVEGGWRSARGQWWSCRLFLHLSKHLPVSFCCVTKDKARRSVIKSLAEMRAVVEQQRETLIECKWAVCHQITRRAVSSTLLVAHGIEICNANTKRTGSGERRFLWSTSQEKIQKLRSLGMELKWSKRGLNCETQARRVLSVKKLRSVLPSQPPSALNDNQENLIRTKWFGWQTL